MKKYYNIINIYLFIIIIMVNKKGFTLTELIVSITLLVILSTIWFVSYSSFLIWTRDSSRISDLSSIWNGLIEYVTRWSLPTPEWYVDIYSWTELLWKQWYMSPVILEKIWYKWLWVDPVDKTYYSYYLLSNGKNFQLMWFLEDQGNLQLTYSANTLKADEVDYTLRIPFFYGNKLWILTDSNNTPIQYNETIKAAWTINVSNTSLLLTSHLKNNMSAVWTWTIISKMSTLAEVKGNLCTVTNNEINCTSLCKSKPAYSATFIEGNATKEDTPWQNTKSWNPCYYECDSWLVWDDCGGSTTCPENYRYSLYGCVTDCWLDLYDSAWICSDVLAWYYSPVNDNTKYDCTNVLPTNTLNVNYEYSSSWEWDTICDYEKYLTIENWRESTDLKSFIIANAWWDTTVKVINNWTVGPITSWDLIWLDITFINNGEIQGLKNWGDALTLSSELKLINNGSIKWWGWTGWDWWKGADSVVNEQVFDTEFNWVLHVEGLDFGDCWFMQSDACWCLSTTNLDVHWENFSEPSGFFIFTIPWTDDLADLTEVEIDWITYYRWDLESLWYDEWTCPSPATPTRDSYYFEEVNYIGWAGWTGWTWIWFWEALSVWAVWDNSSPVGWNSWWAGWNGWNWWATGWTWSQWEWWWTAWSVWSTWGNSITGSSNLTWDSTTWNVSGSIN